jgi:undecaprenyl-diphosphatase
MTFMPNPLASTTRLPRLLALGTLAPRATFWGSKLVAADLAAVRRISAAAERSPAGRMFAVAISKLGNGWIYPILAAIISSSRRRTPR